MGFILDYYDRVQFPSTHPPKPALVVSIQVQYLSRLFVRPDVGLDQSKHFVLQERSGGE
jgi:hypothetical protein